MYTLDLMVDNGDLKEFELLHIEEQDKESAFDVFMDEIINEEKAFYVQNDENAKKLGRLINSELGGLDDCDYYSLSFPTKYEIMLDCFESITNVLHLQIQHHTIFFFFYF